MFALNEGTTEHCREDRQKDQLEQQRSHRLCVAPVPRLELGDAGQQRSSQYGAEECGTAGDRGVHERNRRLHREASFQGTSTRVSEPPTATYQTRSRATAKACPPEGVSSDAYATSSGQPVC